MVSASGTDITIDTEGGIPKATAPRITPPAAFISSTQSSRLRTMSRARRASRCPSSVMMIPRGERFTKGTPSSSSSLMTCWDNDGWATRRRCAAADSDGSSEIAMKYLR